MPFSKSYLLAYFLVLLAGNYTNLFFFAFGLGLLLCDGIRCFASWNRAVARKNLLSRMGTTTIAGVVFLPYLFRMIKIVSRGDWYKPEGTFYGNLLPLRDTFLDTFNVLGRAFEVTSHGMTFIPFLLILALLLIFSEKKARTYFGTTLGGWLLGFFTLTFVFVYGKMTKWFEYRFFLSATIGLLIFLESMAVIIAARGRLYYRAINAILFVGLFFSLSAFIKHLNVHDREDWLKVTRVIHAIPLTEEVSFIPDWTIMNTRFAERVLGYDTREYQPKNSPSRKWLVTGKYQLSEDPKTNGGWLKVLDDQHVVIFCNSQVPDDFREKLKWYND